MILFTILLVALLVMAVVAILGVMVTGGATIFLFGDVIVCVLLIAWIVKKIIKKKKK